MNDWTEVRRNDKLEIKLNNYALLLEVVNCHQPGLFEN
jgi:hypothetical protein